MKKFLFRGLFFFLFGISLFMLLDTLVKSRVSTVTRRMAGLLGKVESVEAIAVGNSHSCALDFQELGIDGYRIAGGGNDIFEVEYQIKSLVPLLENLKYVFLNVSYFTFCSSNSTLSENIAYFDKFSYEKLLKKYGLSKDLIIPDEYNSYVLIDIRKIGPLEKKKIGKAYAEIKNRVLDRSKIRERLYNSIPGNNWIKGDFSNFSISKFSSVIRKDHWKKVFFSFNDENENSKDSVIDEYGQSNHDRYFQHMSADSICFVAENIDVPRYTAVQNISLENDLELANNINAAFVSIIEYLQSKKIRLVFYTPPFHNCFTEFYEEETINSMKKNMQKLQKNFDVEYYDFSNYFDISSNNLLFFNSDHLNKRGANLFSQHFKKAINL
jgi:hypothetical protein